MRIVFFSIWPYFCNISHRNFVKVYGKRKENDCFLFTTVAKDISSIILNNFGHLKIRY